MGITFKTTYDEAGNPQRVAFSSGTSFESGKTYSPHVVNGEVSPIETVGERAIPDPQLSQSQAVDLINRSSSTPSWPEMLAMKEQLVGIPAVTTDFDESRNMYQYMINEMLRAGQEPSGAQLLDVSQIPEGWRRTGGTTFTDPNNPDFLRDLQALASGQNEGVFNLADQDNKGILKLLPFQEGWAQGDPDTGEGLGITDWGEVVENIFTPTPFKLYKMAKSAAEKVKDSDPLRLVGDVGIGALEQAAKPIDYLTQQIENLSKMFRGVK